jgi:hypothetical protein
MTVRGRTVMMLRPFGCGRPRYGWGVRQGEDEHSSIGDGPCRGTILTRWSSSRTIPLRLAFSLDPELHVDQWLVGEEVRKPGKVLVEDRLVVVRVVWRPEHRRYVHGTDQDIWPSSTSYGASSVTVP